MKLLLENWRKYIAEDWRDTSWETDDEKVTIGDVIDYLGDETVDINVSELSQQLPHSLPTHGEERIAAANLDYPIIVVKSSGQYRSVLDGNHRLQKAIDEGAESIKAKILDLDSPETPEAFERMFGDSEEEGVSITSKINSIPMYRGFKGPNPEVLSNKPSYFISNELFASTYGNTAEFKLNIKNPKVVDSRTWLDTYTNTGLIMNPDAIENLEDDGYDSVAMATDTPSGMKLYTALVLNPLESVE